MVTVPPPAHPAPVTSSYINGGFIFREDESLKQYINGCEIVTFDQSSPSGGRPVPAYFRMSETELRKREYPYLLIDRIGWARDPEREMRGPFTLLDTDNYAPDGTLINDPSAPFAMVAQDLPIPVLFTYRVTAWTRFKVQMLWIENQVSLKVFPVRFGAIEMAASNYARDDNTVRRLELLEGPIPIDTVDPENAGKRLFGRAWTVSIPSEILPYDLDATAGPAVEEVILDPTTRTGFDSVVDVATEVNP